MRRNLVSLLVIILLAAATSLAEAQTQWMIETQLITSAYHDVSPVDFSPISLTERLFELSLGLLWNLGDAGHLHCSLPLRTANHTLIGGPTKLGETSISLRLPRLSLEVSGSSTLFGTYGFYRVGFDPQTPVFSSELGLEWTWDPLLTYTSLALTNQRAALKSGLMFAANKRWALGAHLVYRGFADDNPTSAMSYQVYYQSPQGRACEVVFTHYLGTSQQSLGWKVLF